MNKRGLLTALLVIAAGANHASEPRPYDARYIAKAFGISAQASRRQTLTSAQQFTLENSLILTVFGAKVGSVVETSAFRWVEGVIVPLHYEYVQTGLSASTERIDFDWESMTAESHSDGDSWHLDLEKGALDKLSYSVQLGQDIANKALEDFHYQVLDEDGFYDHHYQVTTQEILDTPLGKLNTVKIERIRENDSRRRTTVWLARDWDYLLVRLEQISGSGNETELTIEAATMDGAEVTGL